MKQFYVVFKNCPPLHCVLNSSQLADNYYNLIKNQYQADNKPIFRDPQKYTLEYFSALADRANKTLGWDWSRPKYNLQITTQLHKDLESFIKNGFEQLPAEYDDLLHELHYALHAIESGSKRNHWLQIEWFNNNGFDISADEYPAKLDLEFGDIRLQNPYVGHHPLFVYEQQDCTNILQTCKFHDRVKPGINVVVKNTKTVLDWDNYVHWFATNCPEFFNIHNKETLVKFTGHPVVGKIKNLDDLHIVNSMPVLEFDKIIF